MSATTERGLFVKFDEGVFMRLDHETAVRRAALVAVSPVGTKVKVHRTDVVRSLIRFALDHYAGGRGESVPEVEEVVQVRPLGMQGVRFVALPVAPRGRETVVSESETVGASASVESEEAVEVVSAAPAPMAPEKVEAGTIGGAGALGVNVRMVGVRRE